MSRAKWFANGIVVGLLAVATLNALSYFFRSNNWQGLVHNNPSGQALGFPIEVWRNGHSYSGGTLINQTAMIINVATAFAVGIGIGIVSVVYSRWLTEFAEAMIEEENQQLRHASSQFSIRGLLLMTGASAVIAGLIRASIAASPQLLLGIYFLGPAFLIALAMIPKGLPWQYRIILLTPSTLILIGFAMYIGSRLGLDFERVMFGVFVCWVPQTVIAATFLTLWLAIRYCRKNANQKNAVSSGPVH